MKNKIIVLLLVAATTIIGCRKKSTMVQEADVVSVKSQIVTTRKYAQPILSAGIISSDKEARLSFKVVGVIHEMNFNEGDRVEKGQLMAALYQTEILAQVQQAKNEYEQAIKKCQRIENLHQDNAATSEELENSLSEVTITKQAYEIALFNRQHSSIYASQSGTVIKKHMNEEEIVNMGEPVYTINAAGNNDWVLRIGLSDKEWARTRVGDKATITTDAYGATPFEAVVSEIGSAADALTGTFLIKLKINPNGHRFANGLAAKVSITPSQMETLTFIPVSAIVEADEDTALVYSLNSDQKSVTARIVQVAFVEDNTVAIRSGLEDAEFIITDGASYLSANSVIKL